MTLFSDVVAKYSDGDVVSTRARLTEIADYYSKKAKNLGYVPLVGAATTSGLLSLLFLARNESGQIDLIPQAGI